MLHTYLHIMNLHLCTLLASGDLRLVNWLVTCVHGCENVLFFVLLAPMTRHTIFHFPELTADSKSDSHRQRKQAPRE